MQDQAKSVADASLSKYKKVCFYNQHLHVHVIPKEVMHVSFPSNICRTLILILLVYLVGVFAVELGAVLSLGLDQQSVQVC